MFLLTLAAHTRNRIKLIITAKNMSIKSPKNKYSAVITLDKATALSFKNALNFQYP